MAARRRLPDAARPAGALPCWACAHACDLSCCCCCCCFHAGSGRCVWRHSKLFDGAACRSSVHPAVTRSNTELPLRDLTLTPVPCCRRRFTGCCSALLCCPRCGRPGSCGTAQGSRGRRKPLSKQLCCTLLLHRAMAPTSPSSMCWLLSSWCAWWQRCGRRWCSKRTRAAALGCAGAQPTGVGCTWPRLG